MQQYTPILNLLCGRGAFDRTGCLDMVTGNYQYGESGAGPRQLTSVLDDQGTTVANFLYDDAGRMTEDPGKLLTYNGLDQLVHVELPGETIPLVYSYGYNGQRTYTRRLHVVRRL